MAEISRLQSRVNNNMKYTFLIEGNTIIDLIQNIQDELLVLRESQEQSQKHDEMMKTKLVLTKRKNKPWTEYEINFLKENYLSKKISWIAQALQRPKLAVNQKLFHLRKLDSSIKKLNNRASKPVVVRFK